MPLPFTPEQQPTAFRGAAWLALLLPLVAPGPVLTPFLAAAILMAALRHLRRHDLGGSFYNA